jgi:hypothetical protein
LTCKWKCVWAKIDSATRHYYIISHVQVEGEGVVHTSSI